MAGNILIEVQGSQHYEPREYFGGRAQFEQQIEHDQRKAKYAAEHGYKLILIDARRLTKTRLSEQLKAEQ